MIEFSCGKCGNQFKVADELAGRKARCRDCGAAIVVPGTRPTAAPAAPAGLAQAPARAPAKSVAPSPVPPPLPAIPPPLPASFLPPPPPQMRRSSPTKFAGLSLRHVLIIGGGALALLLVILFIQGVHQAMLRVQASLDAVKAANSRGSSGSPQPTNAVFPERPAATPADARGESLVDVTLRGTGPGLPMRVIVYLPAGRHAEHSLPCVFAAPAGTRLIHGSAPDTDYKLEHLPYAQNGFVAVAYELSGSIPETGSDRITYGQLRGPARLFMDAQGGITNAKLAIDFVLEKFPEVDPSRLYAAGHSSAAVVALDLAAADPRIRAVAAYAPACDMEARFGSDLRGLDTVIPGVNRFVKQVSPIRLVQQINCPVYLFHADDDSNVPLSDNQQFADAMTAAGKQIQFARVPSGNHYQSMISRGIPGGINFFNRNGANAVASAPTETARDGAMRQARLNLPDRSVNAGGATPGGAAATAVNPDPRAAAQPPAVATQTWEPDAASLRKLGQPVAFHGYRLRPPAEFEVDQTIGTISMSWKPAGAQRTTTRFTLRVTSRPNNDSDFPTIMTTTGRSPAGAGGVTALIGGTVDYGTIHTIKFARVKRVQAGSTSFVYSGYDGRNWISLRGTTIAQDGDFAQILEAAARTIERVE